MPGVVREESCKAMSEGCVLKRVRNAQGVVYVGLQRTDAADGMGAFYHQDGHKYFGEYRGNVLDGLGVHYYITGNRYSGSFRGGSRAGAGRYEFATGSNYWGEYESDKRSGYGVYSWPTGDVFFGQFEADQPHGLAVCDNKTGIRTFEKWSHGQRVSAVRFDGSVEAHALTLHKAQQAKVTRTQQSMAFRWCIDLHARTAQHARASGRWKRGRKRSVLDCLGVVAAALG